MDFKNFELKRTILAIVASGLVYFLATSIFGLVTQVVFPYDIFSIGGMRAVDDPLMM